MLLINANILPMQGEDIPNGFVRVTDSRIEQVGSMSDVPCAAAEEVVIDLSGKMLLPGFIDAHSHIGLAENGLGIEGDDLNEETDPNTPNLRTIDAINPLDICFAEARRSGVTSVVVSPGSANPIAGQICAMKTAGRWIDQMILREPLGMKFALGENPKMVYGTKAQSPVTRMATAAMIREQLCKAQHYMQELSRSHIDDELDPPTFDAKCEALLPVLRREVRAHFHAHKAYDILTAVRIAKEFSLDFVIVHATEGHLIADILAEQEIEVICGPLLGTRTKPELVNMTAHNCALLSQAGVHVAISTDHPEIPVDLLASSASFAVSHGMERRAALASITSAAAQSIGLFDRIGSIAPGKDADLLVFGQDPLQAYVQPERVFINGKEIID